MKRNKKNNEKYKNAYLNLKEKIGNEIKVQKAGALTNEESFNDFFSNGIKNILNDIL